MTDALRIIRLSVVALLAVVLKQPAAPPPAAPTVNSQLAVALSVYQAPTALRADGKRLLAYEVFIDSYFPRDLTLLSIEVVSGSDPDKLLGHYQGDELQQMLGRPGLAVSSNGTGRPSPVHTGKSGRRKWRSTRS